MFVGADILPDADGNAWLLELNCPPCLGAYQGKMDEALLDDNPMEQAIAPLVTSVMRDLIGDFVLPALFRSRGGAKGGATAKGAAKEGGGGEGGKEGDGAQGAAAATVLGSATDVGECPVPNSGNFVAVGEVQDVDVGDRDGGGEGEGGGVGVGVGVGVDAESARLAKNAFALMALKFRVAKEAKAAKAAEAAAAAASQAASQAE